MHAGNLENCLWILQVLITPLIPLITLPSLHYAWELSMPNFLPEEWVVLYKKDAWDNCMHRIWDCKCPWVKARKMHGDAPIEVYAGEGSWVEAEWENIATHRFVVSHRYHPSPWLCQRRQLQYACYGMDTFGGEKIARKKW